MRQTLVLFVTLITTAAASQETVFTPNGGGPAAGAKCSMDGTHWFPPRINGICYSSDASKTFPVITMAPQPQCEKGRTLVMTIGGTIMCAADLTEPIK